MSNDIQAKYNQVKSQIDKLKLQNEMRKQKIAEYREDIEELGFNPDNLDKQMEHVKAKVEVRLGELENKINQLLEGLNKHGQEK